MRGPDQGRGPPLKRERRPAGNGTAALKSTDSNSSEYKSQVPKWEPVFFGVTLQNGARACRSGSSWRSWAIHCRSRGWYVVTHLPTGCRLTEFGGLAVARRWCETIDSFADWSGGNPAAYDSALVALMHREALRLTGARPDLRVAGGAA